MSVEKTITYLRDRINAIESDLHPFFPEHCTHLHQFVIASTCLEYTVGFSVNRNYTVEFFTDFPMRFTPEQAQMVAHIFEASSGKGLITWQVLSVEEYNEKHLAELRSAIETLEKYNV